MVGRRRKSKRRLGGREPKPPKNFHIYLDENLHRCRAILDVLADRKVTIHQHFTYFPEPGEPDSAWLPFVGRNGWSLVTTDESFRYNELERLAVIKYKVKVFAFMDNTVGAKAMAAALGNALPRIMNLSQTLKPPFVCSITEHGRVHLRWRPKGGELRLAARTSNL